MALKYAVVAGLVFSLCLVVVIGKKGPADNRVEALELTSVTREIDLSSPLVKQKVTMVVENKASKSVSALYFTVERQLVKRLAFIDAQVQVGKDEMIPAPMLKDSPLPQQDQATAFKIAVPSVSPGATVTVVVDAVFFNAIVAFPSHISQSDNQLVKFTGSSYVFSPYPSSTQSTTFTLPNTNIESFSRVAPTNSADKTITYGPYSDVPAFSYSKVEIHFENNGPFLSVAEVERIIEVSHWGNIAVEEHVHIRHIGAVLKGAFSRYDFQRNSGASAVKSYTTMLPAAAQDMYYRDEIGNISTSNARTEEDFVSLELRPRFPLFGGWQTRYYYGYNLPSYEYLFHDGNRFMLKMRLLDHVFDDQLVEKLTVKIILPEGVKNIDFRPPSYDVELADQEVKLTYLDTVGRPVVVCRAQNLVEQHIQDFELHYTFERVMLLQEPLLIVVALYLFFLFVIFVVRLDFSITKDAAVLARQQASVIIDSIKQAHYKRDSLIQKYRSVITNFKSSKDSGSSSSSKRNLDEEFKKLGEKVSQLVKDLQSTDMESAAKVQDIQKKMSEVKTLVDESWWLADKVVKGSVTKQQYLEQSKKTDSKMEKLMQDVESVVQTL